MEPNTLLYYLALEHSSLADDDGTLNKKVAKKKKKKKRKKKKSNKEKQVGHSLRIYANCLPIAKFQIDLDSNQKIDDMMTKIGEKVERDYGTTINVLRLQFCGDGDVTKGIPFELKVGELLEDQDEVLVEFTVQAGQFQNTSQKESEDVPIDSQSEVFVCPFTFSGSSANLDMKMHLSHVKPTPTSVPKSLHGEAIRCPLYFFNQEDAAQHINESYVTMMGSELDLRTFWERTEAEAAKHSNELIKQELSQKEQRLIQTEKNKKKKQKRKEQTKLKKAVDKKEKERREQEERERVNQERERVIQARYEKQKRKRVAEVNRNIGAIVEEILKSVDTVIEKKLKEQLARKKLEQDTQRELSRNQVKSNKKKNKKKKGNKGPAKNLKLPPIPDPEPPSKPSQQKVEPVLKQEERTNGVILQSDRYYPEAVTQKLHKEIKEYTAQIQSIVEQGKWRADKMLERIRGVVGGLWPKAQVEVYGSYATGLCIPSSDLDLVIVGIEPEELGTIHPVSALATALKELEWVKTLQAIETAKVPVIKVSSKDEGIQTDITFDIQGIANTPAFCTPEGTLAHHEGQAAIQLILKFKKEIPDMIQLVLPLKQLLYERNLNNTFTGGLSSYCLVLMIISFLQLYGNNGTRKKNFGTLLLDFFEVYGQKFDFQTTGISVTDAGSHFTLGNGTFAFPAKAVPLVIVDPFNPAHSVSQQVTGISQVKTLFQDVHKTLVSPFYSTYTPATLLSRVLRDPSESIQQRRRDEL